MKIAIVGCGYVADHYMETLANHANLELCGVTDLIKERADVLAERWGVATYASLDEILADDDVELVVNLTEPQNHYAVSRKSLMAGRHVYSEKPLAVEIDQAKELVALAASRGLTLSSAPCSALSESAQTLWKAVREGAVGRVRLIYAELDDNPIYLMHPEGWKNEAGIPWPYLNEYETGCTLEHAGYYLTWLAAIFGPAVSVTAFAECLVPDKTTIPLDPPDTPDFSVACITFASGPVARLTCSIVAPYDHRIRIIGDEGVLGADECWHYGTPVYLERFTQVGMNARKARTVRGSNFLQSLFGARGRKQALAVRPASQFRARMRDLFSRRRSPFRVLVKAVSKRELVSMDFFRGVAEMADSIVSGRRCALPADFVLHVNELTLAIQNARTDGGPYKLTTSFEALSPLPETLASPRSYAAPDKPPRKTLLNRLIARLHRH